MGISLGEIDGRDKGSSILSAGSGYPSTTKKSDVVQLYRLMLIDEETGLPRRAASLSEAQLIAQTLYRDAANSSLPCLRTASTGTPESDSDSDSGSLRSACQVAKHSGCDHCGTSVSPQWRRGPPAKPILCNACGTRFRRTNQLSPLLSTAAAALRGSPVLPRKRCSASRGADFERAPKLARMIAAQ